MQSGIKSSICKFKSFIVSFIEARRLNLVLGIGGSLLLLIPGKIFFILLGIAGYFPLFSGVYACILLVCIVFIKEENLPTVLVIILTGVLAGMVSCAIYIFVPTRVELINGLSWLGDIIIPVGVSTLLAHIASELTNPLLYARVLATPMEGPDTFTPKVPVSVTHLTMDGGSAGGSSSGALSGSTSGRVPAANTGPNSTTNVFLGQVLDPVPHSIYLSDLARCADDTIRNNPGRVIIFAD